jgi:hypothetical protein
MFFDLLLLYPSVDLLSGMFLGVAILDLKQDDTFIGLEGQLIRPVQVNVVDQAPSFLGFASGFLPPAFEHVHVHPANLLISWKRCPSSRRRSGQQSAPVPNSHSARWHQRTVTLAAASRKRSATRSGVSPLLIKASAPAESAAC